MNTDIERMIHEVVIDRGFEINVHSWAGEISVTITDPNDPRDGCATLRGESQPGTIEAQLADACAQALRDEYPQSRGCGKALDDYDKIHATCSREAQHDGPCRA